MSVHTAVTAARWRAVSSSVSSAVALASSRFLRNPITSPWTTSESTVQKCWPLSRWISSSPRWRGRFSGASDPSRRGRLSRRDAPCPRRSMRIWTRLVASPSSPSTRSTRNPDSPRIHYNPAAIPRVLPGCKHNKRERHRVVRCPVGSHFIVQAAEQTAHPKCGPRRRPGTTSDRCTQIGEQPERCPPNRIKPNGVIRRRRKTTSRGGAPATAPWSRSWSRAPT